MGWSRGSEIADRIWLLIEAASDGGYSMGELAHDLVFIMEEYDCDTMEECEFVEDLLKYDEETDEWVIK